MPPRMRRRAFCVTRLGVCLMSTSRPREIESPLRLHFRKVNRVEIIASDAGDERYETTLSDMADACKQRDDFETWRVQFQEFVGHIYEWCGTHRAIVEDCFLATGEGGMKAFITTQGETYCFDFDSAVVDLELELHRIYPMCPVEVLQMPSASPEALQSFFSPDEAFQLYGKPEAAPGESREVRKVR